MSGIPEYDWIVNYPGGPEAFKAAYCQHREDARLVRPLASGEIGIIHAFFCGCAWIENGMGECPLQQCHEHFGTQVWPDHRMPDYADLFAINVIADWMMTHIGEG